MNKLYLLLIVLMYSISSGCLYAQNVGIGTPTPAFRLDVSNGSINTDSLYRITTLPVLSIRGTQNVFLGVDAGLVNTLGTQNVFGGYRAGYSNTTGAENSFVGAFSGWMNNTGSYNTFFGQFAGGGNTTGSNNSIFGRGAGALNNGDFNSFFGTSSGIVNGNGSYNAFFGFASGSNNTNGSGNAFFGSRAGVGNTTGYSNIAIGYGALFSNTTNPNLVAIGDSALHNNGLGASSFLEATLNTAVGSKALFGNTTGYYNTALGYEALSTNESGTSNSAFGTLALSLSTGDWNTSMGAFAAANNGSGSSNTAVGRIALRLNTTGSSNTALGMASLYTNNVGSFNTAVGTNADVGVGNLTNATTVGARAYVTQSNSMVLGSINGVNGATSSTNVGIGLTNPGAPFEVKTTAGFTARFGGNNGMYISLNENDVYRGYIGSYSGTPEDVDFGTGVGNNAGDLHLTIQAVPKLTVQSNGDVDLANELNRSSVTGGANLVPIAYGSVNGSTGAIRTGSGNFSVVRNVAGSYSIVINGETYTSDTHIVTVTAHGPSVRFITVSRNVVISPTGIMVFIWNNSVVAVDNDFSFVVHKP